jgi:hypothetical protein
MNAQKQNVHKQPVPRKKAAAWLMLAGLPILLTLGAYPYWYMVIYPHPLLNDCLLAHSVLAWVDENGNGKRDEGEPALEGVSFYYIYLKDEVQNGYRKASTPVYSNQSGRAKVYSGMVACSTTADYALRAVPPPGYQPVTSQIVPIIETEDDTADLLFGFSRIEE